MLRSNSERPIKAESCPHPKRHLTGGADTPALSLSGIVLSCALSPISIGPAIFSDSKFLGFGILMAERANHQGKISLWDGYIENEPSCVEASLDPADYLALVTKEPSTLYFLKRFIVARDKTKGGKPIACCCGYPYPEVTMVGCMDVLDKKVLPKILGRHNWTPRHASAARARVAWLNEAFSGDVDLKGCWVIEAVYCDPNYRGQGLAQRCIELACQQGRENDCSSVVIVCEPTNPVALRLYFKMGFIQVGTPPNSQECLRRVGHPGFLTLRLSLL
jgi:GNAT superfamily N-acetyltransferase